MCHSQERRVFQVEGIAGARPEARRPGFQEWSVGGGERRGSERRSRGHIT